MTRGRRLQKPIESRTRRILIISIITLIILILIFLGSYYKSGVILTGNQGANNDDSQNKPVASRTSSSGTASSNEGQDSRCGDGTTQSPNGEGVFEECDDGNSVNNDVCTNICTLYNGENPDSVGESDRNDPNRLPTPPGGDDKTSEGTNYLVGKGENFNVGEFTLLIVTIGDKITIYLNGIQYQLEVFAITSETVSIDIISPKGKRFLVIKGEIKTFELGDNKMAMKLDDVIENRAFITLASLGKIKEFEEKEKEKSIETIFDETIKEQRVVSTAPQSRSPLKIKTIVYLVVGIITSIMIMIIYKVTKPSNKSKGTQARATKKIKNISIDR